MAEEVDFKLTPLDDNGNPVEANKNEEDGIRQEVQEDAGNEQIESQTEVQEEENVAEVDSSTEENVQQQEEPQIQVSEVGEKVDSSDEGSQDNKELSDDDILSILKERYNVESNSLNDVLSNNEKSESVELTDDVKKFLDFQKETGRGLQDFLKAQRDINSLSDVDALTEYYRETKPHLSAEDISYLISEDFSFDEELDDEKEVRKKKIAFKDEVYKAKQHLNSIADKYKVPLGSSDGTPLSTEVQEAVSFYAEYKENTEKQNQLQETYAKVFREKTDQVFNQDFKGFEFNVGDKKLLFKLSNVDSVKSSQSDVTSMLSNFTDKETGALSDGMKFHKAAFAMNNPDLIAKLAYQQGVADATDGIVKETKNIDMTVRDNKNTQTKESNFKVLDSGDTFSSGLKFRKK